MNKYRFVLMGLSVLAFAVSAGAITLPSEGAGSDNAFAPTESVTIDLGAAATGPWKTTPGTGAGVYDPAQWAVIFRYTSVTIPEGVTVTFKNNAACAPVIWLVQGDVTLNGQIALNGETGRYNGVVNTEPGPGGFRGGRGGEGPGSGGVLGSAGFGPGGGAFHVGDYNGDNGAKFASRYSNEGCFPLIGGSGGGARSNWDSTICSGGAGAGAILIAAGGSIHLNRTEAIVANALNCEDGWAGGGSGGMIRLVAETIDGSGTLQALGGVSNHPGEPGRIRLEAVTNNFAGGSTPNYSFGVAQATPRLLLDDTTPVITPKTLGGKDIPADPAAKMRYPADVQMDATGNAKLVIEAKNVPPASTMIVRITHANGPEETVTATMTGGDLAISTWEADINVANGFSALQVRAQFN